MKIHGNGKLVMWPNVKTENEKPNALLLGFYEAQEEIRTFQEGFTASRPIMPMGVHTSPILAALLYDEKNPWRPRYTTSTASINTLQQILRCYLEINTTPFYHDHKDECDRLWEKLKTETENFEEKFYKDVFEQGKDAFKKLVIVHTINYINLMEVIAYELFKPAIPKNACLTPLIDPAKIPFTDAEKKQARAEAKLFFHTKEKLIGVTGVFTFKASVYPQYYRFLEIDFQKDK